MATGKLHHQHFRQDAFEFSEKKRNVPVGQRIVRCSVSDKPLRIRMLTIDSLKESRYQMLVPLDSLELL
jgi:hypothetical protein